MGTNGNHTPEAIEAMESKLLMVISWRINSPTAMSFVRMIIDFMPENLLIPHEKRIILDKTKEQIKMIANGYEFSSYPNSYIAFASIMNSIEIFFYNNDGGVSFYSDFKMVIGTILQVDDYSCISKLKTMIYRKRWNKVLHDRDNNLEDEEDDIQNDSIDNLDTTKTHVENRQMEYH